MFACLCFTSLQKRGHLETAPHLRSLAKDVKLGKCTVPTGNRTPGRCVLVHYATAAPRKFLISYYTDKSDLLINPLKCFFSSKGYVALDRNLGLGYNTLLLRLIPDLSHVPIDSSTHILVSSAVRLHCQTPT